jgi:glycosyltransferase involved in cell wall biosynthesis
MTGELLVSVVVPTRNRPDLLFRCLDALVGQTLGPAAYEVIVVDDGGGGATKRIVDAVATSTRVPVRYMRAESRGPAAARNLGWRAAGAPVIAFTDDDTVPDVRWLEAGLDAMTPRITAEPPADGAMGAIIVPLTDRPTDHERDTAGLQDAEFATANVFYRRAALESVGGFDERFTAAWREDADLYFTLLERGAALREAPDAVVVHPARRERWGVSLSQQRKSQFNALLYRKHPRLYRERIGRSPRWYYAAVGAFGLSVGAGIAGKRKTSLLAGIAWFLMTAIFAGKRLSETSRTPSHIAEMAVTSAAIPPLSVYSRLKGAVRYRVPFLW